VNDSGRKGSVCTLYELLNEDDSPWRQMDERVALRLLEAMQRKAVITLIPVRPSAALEETGVKFG